MEFQIDWLSVASEARDKAANERSGEKGRTEDEGRSKDTWRGSLVVAKGREEKRMYTWVVCVGGGMRGSVF